MHSASGGISFVVNAVDSHFSGRCYDLYKYDHATVTKFWAALAGRDDRVTPNQGTGATY